MQKIFDPRHRAGHVTSAKLNTNKIGPVYPKIFTLIDTNKMNLKIPPK